MTIESCGAEANAAKYLAAEAGFHDGDTVVVYYRSTQIGYMPRAENHTIARLMDRGERLGASIVELSEYAINRIAGLKIRSSLALNKVPETGVPAREICMFQLCIAMHSDANQATDIPATG